MTDTGQPAGPKGSGCLLLAAVVLVVVGRILLVVGTISGGGAWVYISIAAAVLAGVALVLHSRRSSS